MGYCLSKGAECANKESLPFTYLAVINSQDGGIFVINQRRHLISSLTAIASFWFSVSEQDLPGGEKRLPHRGCGHHLQSGRPLSGKSRY
jgi:hypothetical protein